MLRFSPACQSYDWGKIGSDSLVARLAKSGSLMNASPVNTTKEEKSFFDVFELDEEKHYAELWMGTHPSGPAKVYLDAGSSSISTSSDSGKTILLSDWLKENPTAVGTVPPGYSPNDLPFMFKVLSINTALSIQAHPDKTLATELHMNFPTVYKDSNHKPEMAIALTDFECMNGFRPLAEIINHLQLVPELGSILGEDVLTQLFNIAHQVTGKTGGWCDSKYSSSGMASVEVKTEQEIALTEHALRLFMSTFLNASSEVINAQILILIQRLEFLETLPEKDSRCFLPFLCKLILRLHSDYPGDRGIFFPLVLNTCRLKPGEAFYISANEPHAYISGDIMECMALSDNVVRVGLTPKFKDKETLERMLTYRCVPISYCKKQTLDAFTMLYRPPSEQFSEFEVECITLAAKQTTVMASIPCASVIIITSYNSTIGGNINDVIEYGVTKIPIPLAGTCFFQSANQAVRVTTDAGSEVVMYRAHINLG